MALWPPEYNLAVHFISSVQTSTVTTSLQQLLAQLSVTYVIRWYLCFIFLNMVLLVDCLYLCILEPLQKMMVMLGACKIGLRPSVIYITDRSKANVCCGSNCFVFWSRVFVLFEPYVLFHIFRSARVTEWPPIV